ncbi:spermatogenesis associated protein 5 [Dinochytrium kinnereticum]|nr:spermatogenesis associated protein 5 [Dinochytrium kinnereticum]
MVKKKGGASASRPDTPSRTPSSTSSRDALTPSTKTPTKSQKKDKQQREDPPTTPAFDLLESLSKLKLQDGAEGLLVDSAPVPASDKGVTRHRHILRVHLSQTDMVKRKLWVGEVVTVKVVRTGDNESIEHGEDRNVGKVSKKGEELENPSKSGDDVQAVGTIWASPTCKEGYVLLSAQLLQNAGIELGEMVIIDPVKIPIPEASRLVLRPSVASPDFEVDEVLSILMKEILVDIRFVTLQKHVEATYYGKVRQFKVEKGELREEEEKIDKTGSFSLPSSPVILEVSRSTEVVVVPFERKSIRAIAPSSQPLDYSSIGGLRKEVEEIRKIVEAPLLEPERFSKFGLRPPRGVLLFGPPGTGKTLVARVVAAETGAHVIIINGPDVLSKFYGETEERLKTIFQEAEENAPSIIFIDEIDSICPKRDESSSDLEKRVVTTLLTLMDGAHHKNPTKADGVVIIAATNRPNVLDDALRRPGRFDREIEIGIPDAHGRLDILKAQLKNVPHALTDDDIRDVSARAHGYVGADLAAIVREAGLSVVQRVTKAGSKSADEGRLRRFRPVTSLEGLDLKVRLEDLNWALAKIKPSAMREIMVEVPKVLWTDIGGQEDIKQRLKEAVEWPLKHPEVFERFKIKPPKGILLYGPPGCSKTLLAKALATEAGLNFLAVKGPELFSKWVGDSEKAVRDVFKKARAASPSIIFFDEIDAIAVRRGSGDASVADRVLSQLLSEMDGVEPLVNVTVVAATNRPDILDSALLRPGRIDRILYVSPPDFDARKEILSIQTSKMACATDVDVMELATKSDGFSGAEVVSLCQEAALLAMEEDIQAKEVKRDHFLAAVAGVTPRITAEMIAFYDQFKQRSGLRSV